MTARHRSEGEEGFLLRRDRRVEDITETDDVPAPFRPVHGLAPHHGEFTEPRRPPGQGPRRRASGAPRGIAAAAPTGRGPNPKGPPAGCSDPPAGCCATTSSAAATARSAPGISRNSTPAAARSRTRRTMGTRSSAAASSRSPVLAPATDNGPRTQAVHAVPGAGSREPGAGRRCRSCCGEGRIRTCVDPYGSDFGLLPWSPINHSGHLSSRPACAVAPFTSTTVPGPADAPLTTR